MRSLILFPFLLAFLPAWQLILKNYDEIIFQDILISVSTIAIPIAIWVVITKIIKNGNKAALITGVGVAFFFYFGYLQDMLFYPLNKTSVLMIISIIVFIISTIYFVKSKKSFTNLVKIANIFAVTIILFTLIQFAIPDAFAEKPNVYHIILDEYTDNEILLKQFNYDNGEFLEFLNKNEFYIPDKSFSTFGSTPDALNLILNMDYKIRSGWVSNSYLDLKTNKVMSTFSDHNYSVIETNSGMRWKDFSNVDTRFCYDVNFINSEFLEQILRKSIIKYFIEQHQIDTRRDVVKCVFNELSEIALHSDGPTYVFSHLYIPHPPFIFGPNGEHVNPDHSEISGLNNRENTQGYLNQLIYATSEISIVITNIVENDPNAIIILQGDTGTKTGINPDEKTTIKEIYQAHSILYAVRMPDVNNFENAISANTYRIIFNNYFDMDYEYLEQRVYVPNEDNTWKDITKTISEYKFG
jgi:hypothetical protein